jgi:hypothetical protein
VDELAKLRSSRALVPTGVFFQELHEPSIAKALAKVNKVAEPSQETPPPNEAITEYHQLQTIPITRPFSTWGLDLEGPFKKAKGGLTHIFVTVDKFMKWIEVKSPASIIACLIRSSRIMGLSLQQGS